MMEAACPGDMGSFSSTAIFEESSDKFPSLLKLSKEPEGWLVDDASSSLFRDATMTKIELRRIYVDLIDR